MKKLIMLIVLCLLFVLAGCGSAPAAKTSDADHSAVSKTLTIGTMPDIDSLPLLIAQEKGFFADEGVNVNLQQFKSAMDRDSALQSGNLDGAISDMLAVAFSKSGGFDVRVTSRTDGSYKLIAGKDEPDLHVAGIPGKDVAVSKNTIIEYVTDQILQSQGIPAEAVNKVVIPQIPTRLEMLQNGKLSAATLPEPMASIAVHNGCHFITGSDELGINPGVMMFTGKAVNEKWAALEAMYRAYNRAVAYLNQADRSEYIDIVVTKGGFPPAAREALQLPKYHEAALPEQADVEQCINWLTRKQLIATAYSYQDLVIDLFKK